MRIKLVVLMLLPLLLWVSCQAAEDDKKNSDSGTGTQQALLWDQGNWDQTNWQ